MESGKAARVRSGPVSLLIVLVAIVASALVLVSSSRTGWTVTSAAASARRASPRGPPLPDAWNWQQISEAEARGWARRHKRRIAPGRYASPVLDQHRENWCGCCYLTSSVQMLQDKLNLLLGMHRPDEPMHPVVEIDMQGALDAYDALYAPSSPSWNACRGGDPLRFLRSVKQGLVPLQLVVGGGVWRGYPCALRAGTSNLRLDLEEPRQLRFAREEYPAVVQERILRYGPLVLAVNAQAMNDAAIASRGGVIDVDVRGGRNHAVCVVGWVSVGPRRCWVVRNSWGWRRVPERKPDSLECVSRGSNRCVVPWRDWGGSEENPGWVYIPLDHPDNLTTSAGSPWYECVPRQML